MYSFLQKGLGPGILGVFFVLEMGSKVSPLHVQLYNILVTHKNMFFLARVPVPSNHHTEAHHQLTLGVLFNKIRRDQHPVLK